MPWDYDDDDVCLVDLLWAAAVALFCIFVFMAFFLA